MAEKMDPREDTALDAGTGEISVWEKGRIDSAASTGSPASVDSFSQLLTGMDKEKSTYLEDLITTCAPMTADADINQQRSLLLEPRLLEDEDLTAVVGDEYSYLRNIKASPMTADADLKFKATNFWNRYGPSAVVSDGCPNLRLRKGSPMLVDADMEQEITSRNIPPPQNPTRRQMNHVEGERLMDRRMYMEATRGHVGDFTRILDVISTEKELQRPEILHQVSPGNNTCLHIAASFGHRELAEYIVEQCPDLIQKKNFSSDTALHIAARRKDLSFVKLVMDSWASASAASRDVEKAEYSLLRIVGNKEENTVLHEALIYRCKEEEVREILTKIDPLVAYCPNKEGKTPLYLAAEERYFHVIDAIQNYKVHQPVKNNDSRAKPAVYGAILGRSKKILEKILQMEPVGHTDKHGTATTPLHYAASIGYLEGVRMLLDRSSFDLYQRDSDGFYPIHVASSRGHLDIVKELLHFSPDSKELLSENHDDHGASFLHVAAKFGRKNIVKFVLKEKGLEKLINEKDSNGNTPLHVATMHGHPEVVCSLTWDRRVDANHMNNEGRTAFEIASSVKHPSFHQRLVWIALKSAGAKQNPGSKVPRKQYRGPSKPPNMTEFKDRVNTLMLVSTLVATVTFAAGFTVPGGNNDDSGTATLLTRHMFHVFVICNTIALYTSITAVITLIWAQLGDLNLMGTAMNMALPLLGTAVTAVCLAFTAGVYLVVSNLYWLAITVLVIGSISLVGLLVPFLLFFLPSDSTNCILRYASYYPFRMLIWASSSRIKQED